MPDHHLSARMTLLRPRDRVFAFFADARNLERITPPALRFRIRDAPGVISEGSLITYRLRLDGIPFGWVSRISEWRPNDAFVDEQVRGPYARWVHRHEFSDAAGGTEIRDEVEIRLPFAPLGEAAWPYVRWRLRGIFSFRQKAVAEAFGADPRSVAARVELA